MLDRRMLFDVVPLFHDRRAAVAVRDALDAYQADQLLSRWLADLDRRLSGPDGDVTVREIRALEALRGRGDWLPPRSAYDVLGGLALGELSAAADALVSARPA